MFPKELQKLINKTRFNYIKSINDDFIYIPYHKNTKTIIKIKEYIENSNEYQWYNHNDLKYDCEYTIIIKRIL